MENEYSGRLSPTMPDMNLNTLIEVKKDDDLNINFYNNLNFNEDTNKEHEESQFL